MNKLSQQLKQGIIALLLLNSTLSIAATSTNNALPSLGTPYYAEPITKRSAAGAKELKQLLNKELFQLQETRKSGITPHVYVDHIPQDLGSLSIKDMKQLFIQLILPSTLKVNAHIEEQRAAVTVLLTKQNNGQTLTNAEQSWLANLTKHYSVKADGTESLLDRMDIIPPSLAITQAIMESGWGRSRFAKQGNVLFGLHLSKNSQRKFIKASGANVRLAVYDSIFEAVDAYIHNINTTRAYRKLRDIRGGLRNKNELPDGWNLAAGLGKYSELGDKYIGKLRSIIKFNKLAIFDKARLRDGHKSYIIQIPR
jgi:Bax protein